MGNRTVVIFPDSETAKIAPAVYLHWNGGPESVYAFLDYLKETGNRADDYSVARFCQIVGNYFGGTLSLGVRAIKMDKLTDYYQGDNGHFIVKPGTFKIGRRLVADSSHTWDKPKLREMSQDEIDHEAKQARKHDYWQPKDDRPCIMDQLRQVNCGFFTDSKAT